MSNHQTRFSSSARSSVAINNSDGDDRSKWFGALWATLFAVMMMLATMSGSAKADDIVRIVAFGDSLSAGYQLPSGKSFSDQLAVELSGQGLAIEVTNAAVSGDTTSSGLARLDWSVPDGTNLVILELGANDALQGLPIDQAKANLASMIERLKEREIAVLLAGMKAPPNMGEAYVSKFDAIYPELAERYNLPFYPFFLDGVAARTELNLADGIHPNEEGIAVIVKKIAPFVSDIVKTIQ